MEDDVLAEARSFFNLVREASNQGDVDLILAKILAAGSKHVSLVNAHLAKNGVRPGWDGHLFRFGEVLGWRGEVKGWQDAVDEVVALGLDPGVVSLKYWQQHIQLPHVFVKARKFFEILDNMTADQMKKNRLQNIKNGHRLIQAVEACRSEWPRYQRPTMRRRVDEWKLKNAGWFVEEKTLVAAAAVYHATNPQDVAVVEAMAALDLALDARKKLQALSVEIRSEVKERRLKKRTCCQCGTTVPLSARAFAYCAGCRHESVARKDRPRFCSVECQRAHWVAGHMHACLCQHIFPLCFTRTGKKEF